MSSRRIGDELLGKGKWLALHNFTYTSVPSGEARQWETVVRLSGEDQSRQPIGDLRTNVVAMIAIKEDDHILLVKQYRPALDAMTLEMPAGLIDDGETGEEAAKRELLEETGHSCEGLEGISLPVANDPGLTNVGMMVAEVKASAERDESRMDPGDRLSIETVSVPIDKLKAYLDDQLEKGIVVDGCLYHFALGVTYGRRGQQ